MKIAFVGGGGFRMPTVYEALREAPFVGSAEELALFDVNPERLERISLVIRGLDEEAGGRQRIPVRTTTSLDDAVEGASFVLSAIRVGGLEARVIDERVPLDLGVLGQETTGPAGVAFALRTIPVMLKVAKTVSLRARKAWFVNFTNPAGLVTEAVQGLLGDRAVGICDTPAALCGRVAAALGRKAAELRFDYVGVNHLGWLNRVWNTDGHDLLPELLADDRRLAAIPEATLLGLRRVRAMGALPNEYIVYHERPGLIVDRLRARSRGEVLLEQQASFYERSATTGPEALARWRAVRDLRHGTYMSEAWTNAPRPQEQVHLAGGPGEHGYASVAVDLMTALLGGRSEPAPILNVANRGTLEWLDDGAVIEVPCDVAEGLRPRRPGPVPPEQRRAIERMKEVERLTLRAVADRSPEVALRAIARHPLVPSRDVAERIWQGYMAGHSWLREVFG